MRYHGRDITKFMRCHGQEGKNSGGCDGCVWIPLLQGDPYERRYVYVADSQVSVLGVTRHQTSPRHPGRGRGSGSSPRSGQDRPWPSLMASDRGESCWTLSSPQVQASVGGQGEQPGMVRLQDQLHQGRRPGHRQTPGESRKLPGHPRTQDLPLLHS